MCFLLHEIIEQMLSIKAGKKIFERLQTLCGGQITPNVIGQLTDEQIRSAGISNAKVGFIRNITRAVQENALNFDKLANQPDEEVMKQLTAIKGIGNWTAKMYLIFVLNRMDILPYEDGAFLQSYRWLYKPSDSSSKAIKKKCNKWRPFSSIAARYLYVALDMGLTKSEFHLFKNLEVWR